MDSSQAVCVCVIMERTDLCAVVRRIHRVSDLFSPLFSSSSSGENVILCWNKKTNKERRGDLRDFRNLLNFRARTLRWLTDRGKKEKSDGKNKQISRLLCAAPSADLRPDNSGGKDFLVQLWIILMGSLCRCWVQFPGLFFSLEDC